MNIHLNKRTTRNSLLVVLLATATSLAVFVPLAVSSAAAPERKQSEGGGEKGASLEHAMEQMGRAYKRLRSGVSDPSKNKDNLKYVADLQRATLEAKLLVPDKLETLTGEGRETAVKEYRGMLVNLLKQELEVEEHLLAGDNAKAAEAFATLDEIQKQGHKEYRGKGEHDDHHEHHEGATTKPSN